MMKIHVFPVRPLGANCYLIEDEETKNCLIIDLGGDFLKIRREMTERRLKPVSVLFTHGHFDHISGGADAKAAGIPVGISVRDEYMLSGKENLAASFGFPYTPFEADFRFSGEETLSFGPFRVKVIATPGHSEGSVCFLIGNCLFSGDTLFYRSYGRTDFDGGDESKLFSSVRDKLFRLPPETVVYPGHECPTTIGDEIRMNPLGGGL